MPLFQILQAEQLRIIQVALDEAPDTTELQHSRGIFVPNLQRCQRPTVLQTILVEPVERQDRTGQPSNTLTRRSSHPSAQGPSDCRLSSHGNRSLAWAQPLDDHIDASNVDGPQVWELPDICSDADLFQLEQQLGMSSHQSDAAGGEFARAEDYGLTPEDSAVHLATSTTQFRSCHKRKHDELEGGPAASSSEASATDGNVRIYTLPNTSPPSGEDDAPRPASVEATLDIGPPPCLSQSSATSSDPEMHPDDSWIWDPNEPFCARPLDDDPMLLFGYSGEIQTKDCPADQVTWCQDEVPSMFDIETGTLENLPDGDWRPREPE